MKIAIVDDIRREIEKLSDFCIQWGKENHIDISIEVFTSGESFLENYEHAWDSFHLIFLDIYMKSITGIETAEKIRSITQNCLIVFLTSSSEHIWEAFPLHPFDYVMKPYECSRIYKLLDDAVLTLPKISRFIEVKVNRQITQILFSEIGYLQSENHHVRIFKQDGENLKVYIKFQELYNQVKDDNRFILCNRGLVVNMDFILQSKNDGFILKNNTMIALRVRDIQRIQTLFANYQFERLKRKSTGR